MTVFLLSGPFGGNDHFIMYLLVARPIIRSYVSTDKKESDRNVFESRFVY